MTPHPAQSKPGKRSPCLALHFAPYFPFTPHDSADRTADNRGELTQRAVNVIDLYELWRDAGYIMPASFRRGRDNP